MTDNATIARKAIVVELKRRALALDPNVVPLGQDDAHRWSHPQENYYSGSGLMKCPICESGTLRYSRAQCNGHVHASCSTKGCVFFME